MPFKKYFEESYSRLDNISAYEQRHQIQLLRSYNGLVFALIAQEQNIFQHSVSCYTCLARSDMAFVEVILSHLRAICETVSLQKNVVQFVLFSVPLPSQQSID